MVIPKYLFSYFMVLSIVVFNARGLLNREKFEMVKELCKDEDLIILQETNWRGDVMDDFKKRWAGEIFFNNDDGRMGRGVAILIRKGIDVKVKVIYDDGKGKSIAVEIRHEDECFVIFNLHAPNEVKEKKDFFNELRGLVEKWKKVMMVGDFNTVFCKRDLADGMVFRADEGRKELRTLMEENNLMDVWRERNEKKREFTRKQIVGNFLCQSRIDHILSTRNLDYFIEDIFYKDTVLSDHKMVSLKIDFNKKERGPGVWVLNTELLKSESYKLEIEKLLETEKEDGMYVEDKRIWWENVKYEIKKFSIKYSKTVQRVKRKKEKEIRMELREEQQKRSGDIQKIIVLEEKLKKIEEGKCKGAMMRSKAKYIVEGERCTKFFFNLEKSKGKAELMKEIKRKDGKTVKGTEEILKEIKCYYEDLFRTNKINDEEKKFLLQQITAKVEKEDKKLCEKEIEKEEIMRAIELLNGGKSPGIDGLVGEFYKAFKDKISTILKEVYDQVFEKGELYQMMGMGLMKIIYKGKGDKTVLNNFRPITMLNTDLKILAKVLADRMRKVLPTIIKTNQSYGVNGRDIADTISSIRDLIGYMREENKCGYVISLDFEKAFDRVEHSFLFSILERFGFGINFIKWITILYRGAMTKVKCNGFLTEPFKITRSIRQGCPLSAQLYSLVAEPLGMVINKEERIQGIELERGIEGQKIFQYADDTTVIVRDIGSVGIVMEEVRRFCQGTGAKINEDKTVCMRFGKSPVLIENFAFKEVQEMKILGVILGKEEKNTRDKMWEEIIGAMERRLVFWRYRNLNLKGKILIVNVLLLSKIWYIMSVSSMPFWTAQRIKRCILDFLWEKKPARIAYNTLIGPVEEGGLGLVDIEQKKKSMRVKTVKKYLDEENKSEWKITMELYLNICGNLKIGNNILWMKLKNGMMQRIPDFYKEVLSAWSSLLSEIEFKPHGREMILNQPLFLNKNIVSQGKEIYFKKWIEVGFLKVRDVLYEYKEGFLPIQVLIDAMEEAKEEYNENTLKKQYEEVKKAIPKEWVEEIQNEEKSENRMDVFLKRGDKLMVFNLCTVKMFYHFFVNSVFKKPIANQFWLRHFNGVDEGLIWKNMRWKLLDTDLECLDYFIRQNVMFTEMRLCKIGMEQDAICKVCKTEDEGILHLFLLCEGLGQFFGVLKKLVCDLRKTTKEISWNITLMLGLNDKCQNKQVINLLLILAKKVIWKRRNIAKNKNYVLDLWLYFKSEIENYIQTLYDFFKWKNDMEMFNTIFTKDVRHILEKYNVVSPGSDVSVC